MLEAISLGLEAIKEGLILANTPLSEKYLAKALALEEKIAELEENVPYDDQIDSLITKLYKEFKRCQRGAILAMRQSRGAT